MRIALYNTKGSAGKTPIATNIVLDREYALGTNEPFHVFEGFIPDDRLLTIHMEESFPEIPDDINIVFDLAGSISTHAHSISSALKQADLVIVPTWNEVKSLHSAVGTIKEVANFTDNVLVVATKLQKKRREILQNGDWTQSADFKNIKAVIDARAPFPITVLPLKFSAAFDTIFEQEKSIRQLMGNSPLAAYNYRKVADQFNAIYDYIDKVSAQCQAKTA